jgi:rsbT co-antagonist protein RsbR
VALGAAVLYLLLLTTDPPSERHHWLEWLSSAGRTLAVAGLGLWGLLRSPWRPAGRADQRRGPVIATIALVMTATWCVVIWLNPRIYTDAWFTEGLWYTSVISLLLQACWLVRRGFVSGGALALLGSFAAYILSTIGVPNIGNELVYVMALLTASLLLRWWAGFALAVALPSLVHLAQLAGLAPGVPTVAGTFFLGVLLLVIASIAGLYAHGLEHAVDTADARAAALADAQTQLQAQHAQVQDQAAELARHGERLEHEVRARTGELQTALEELRRNAVVLRELQTPVVPVLPGVLVVPLVGAFDDARSERFVGDLLQATERHRARAVLLDVTGLPLIDTNAARTLLQAANAARLLGAAVTLVGVAPETAQTIVGLGVELGGLRAERDLQSAVERLVASPELARAEKQR